MKAKGDVPEEKLWGRYFTPQAVADYVTDWVFSQEGPVRSVLEPAAGDGVFLRSACRHPDVMRYATATAVEIDGGLAEAAASAGDGMASVVHGDFYRAYLDGLCRERYQAVLGNPPYIRYQYLDDARKAMQDEILSRNGMRPNHLVNAWAVFMAACVACMDDVSRIGFVIPSDILHAGYAGDLRRFLSARLNRITVITFRERVFPDIMQDVALFLGEKAMGDAGHKVRVLEFDSFGGMRHAGLDAYGFSDVGPGGDPGGWVRYLLPDAERRALQGALHDPRFIRLSDVARCEVGITTGNNRYFCLDKDTVRGYGLEGCCRPMAGRSMSIQGVRFTQADHQACVRDGSRAYLLDLAPFGTHALPDGAREYVSQGVRDGADIPYKCRVRDPWYAVPSVWAPDAFLLRQSHLYTKFVLNDAGAVNTDTMSRVRFLDPGHAGRAAAAWYTSIAMLSCELEGRVFGGGMLEVLPSGAGRVLLPDIFSDGVMDGEEAGRLLSMADAYVRAHHDVTGLVEAMDREILERRLGFPGDVAAAYRSAWLRLRGRRLARGHK